MLSTKDSATVSSDSASGSTSPARRKSHELTPISTAQIDRATPTARAAALSERPKASARPVASSITSS